MLPHIFLISCDTLRPDHLLPYGYDLPTSYHLDQFAKDAVICRRAYTTETFTPVAHASLLTGLHPENHKLTVDLSIDSNVKLLGEELQKLGYYTSGIARDAMVVFTYKRVQSWYGLLFDSCK